MEKKCKTVDEFNFDEFAAKLSPEESYGKAMIIFKANVETLLKASRMAYCETAGDYSLPDFVAGQFRINFDAICRRDIIQACDDEFLRDVVQAIEELGFIRTDILDITSYLFFLGIGTPEEWLISIDRYEYWEVDESKTFEDIDAYISSLLPPGQGEIFFYEFGRNTEIFPYGLGIYTEEQEKLLEKAKENVERLGPDGYNGGPILNFITKGT